MRAERDGVDRAVQWAQIATAAIGLIGVPILILQLYGARRQERGLRTREFQERYFAREFQSTASLTLSFLTVRNPADCVTKIQAWHCRTHAEDRCLPRTPRRGATVPKAAVNDVQQVMNFFEDFATAYNRSQLVKGIVHDSFASTPVQVFTAAWWYICWRRDGQLIGEQNTDLFIQFQRMVKSLRARQGSAKKTKSPSKSVWILCLPRGGAKAKPADWRNSRRLSTALTNHSECLPGLDERFQKIHPTGHDRSSDEGPWQVLLIPDVDVKPDEHWRSQRRSAERLSCCLSRFIGDEDIDKLIAELRMPN